MPGTVVNGLVPAYFSTNYIKITNDMKIVFFFFIIWVIANSCVTMIEYPRHTCSYAHCPYKGIASIDSKDAIMWYTNAASGSDAFAVDSIHFEHPSYNYD